MQEFSRVLQDNLDSKMKGTQAQGAIDALFKGKMKSYIKCNDIEFESSRIEDFYGKNLLNKHAFWYIHSINWISIHLDIQLNVKGCEGIYDSFRQYVQTEIMDGENAYRAEGHGLQNATKGVLFEQFPPVMHLQLKRFEYDYDKDALVKVNSRYTFDAELCLDEFITASNTIKQSYVLHG